MQVHQRIEPMNRHLFLLLGPMAAFLGGCTMAPEYTRPEAPVPAAWPSGPAYKDTLAMPGAPAAAELEWREFFTDKRLQEVIKSALNNNRDLRVASLNAARARALYGIQRAELLPTANAVGTASNVVPQEIVRTPFQGSERKLRTDDLSSAKPLAASSTPLSLRMK